MQTQNIEKPRPDSKLSVEYVFTSNRYKAMQKKKIFFHSKDALLQWLAEQRQFIADACHDYAMSYSVTKCDSAKQLYSKTI